MEELVAFNVALERKARAIAQEAVPYTTFSTENQQRARRAAKAAARRALAEIPLIVIDQIERECINEAILSAADIVHYNEGEREAVEYLVEIAKRYLRHASFPGKSE